jgi:ankyrin repeat protein
MKIKFKAVTSRDTSRGYNGRILRNLKCAGLSRGTFYPELNKLNNLKITFTIYALALEGNNTKIRTLIEEGRNVDLRDLSGYTPLFWAAVLDKADTVQLLYENGADIVATSRSGENAMHRALKFRGMNIYRYLLEN